MTFVCLLTVYVTTMAHWYSLVILVSLSVTAPARLNIQSLLTQYCAVHPDTPGCKKTVGAFRPSTFPEGPSEPPGGNTEQSCSAFSRRCPQLSNFCIPRNISCSIIGSGQRCKVPDGDSYALQILMCGDGTPVGIRCGKRSMVPQLTQMLIHCKGANDAFTQPVKRLGVLEGPGHTGGAGVYRCGDSGSWEPLYDSPPMSDLIYSCRYSECGRVPQPMERMPMHRRWSWVRAIYFRNNIHCTGTIVSPTAILTAAHCLARSRVSQKPHDVQDFQIELPGPNNRVKRITLTPNAIHIHPRYRPQIGRQHDLALIFFKENKDYSLPVACIADIPHNPTRNNLQVVFRLEHGVSGATEEPVWRKSRATWDSTCRVVGTRFAVACKDELILQPSQFCASHPGLSMSRGSSGSPYMAEVGTSVEEVWVVLGVLSQFSNESSCGLGHSIYSQVVEDSDWIKSCVFDERCT